MLEHFGPIKKILPAYFEHTPFVGIVDSLDRENAFVWNGQKYWNAHCDNFSSLKKGDAVFFHTESQSLKKTSPENAFVALCFNGDYDTVQEMVKNGMNVDCVTTADSPHGPGVSAFYALISGSIDAPRSYKEKMLETVDLFLKKDKNLLQRCTSGMSTREAFENAYVDPLIDPIPDGRKYDLAQRLKISIEPPKYPKITLSKIFSAAQKSTQELEALPKTYGPHVLNITDSDGNTPLMLLAKAAGHDTSLIKDMGNFLNVLYDNSSLLDLTHRNTDGQSFLSICHERGLMKNREFQHMALGVLSRFSYLLNQEGNWKGTVDCIDEAGNLCFLATPRDELVPLTAHDFDRDVNVGDEVVVRSTTSRVVNYETEGFDVSVKNHVTPAAEYGKEAARERENEGRFSLER